MNEVNEPLLAAAGFLAAVVVMLVDRRNAVAYASAAAALGLAPSVAAVSGWDPVLLLLTAGVGAVVGGEAGRRVARRLSHMVGLDPVVPVVAGSGALFGPRSIRAAAGVLVLPAASWVSFNVPLGSASTVTGVLFPAALVWACGAMRLLTARSLEDLAVGVAAVGMSAATAWFLAGGTDTVGGALACAALAPAAAIVAGWLGGRRATRVLSER